MKRNWFVTDNDGSGGAVTATKAASAGRTHVITAIIANYDAAATIGTLTVTLASGVTFTVEVFGHVELYFGGGLAGGSGEAVSAALEAGGSGQVDVTLIGYTA